MAEPLLGAVQLTGEHDAVTGTFEVRAWVAGPAGTATIAFGGGVELDVDVADPSICVALRFDAPDPRAPTTLRRRTATVVEALLGAERAAMLDALVRAGGKPLVLVRGASRADIGTDRRGGVDRRLQQRALARSLAEHDTTPLGRGLALLEAGVAGRRLRGVPGLRGRTLSDVRAGAELISDELVGIDLPSAEAARALSRLLGEASALLAAEPRLAARLLVLSTDLRTGRFRIVPPPADADAFEAGGRPSFDASVMPAMAAPSGGARAAAYAKRAERPRAVVEVERWSLPDALRGEPIEAVIAEPSDVVVTLRGWAGRADGWWARVSRAADGVLLAAAPMQSVGGDAVAVLLTPEHHGIVVDVTADPSSRRPSAARRRAEAALAAGRHAAQAERRGDTAATTHWHACSDQWAEAQDSMRAGLARSYATGAAGRGERRVVPAPLVADLLIET